MRPIFERFPELHKRVAPIELATLPTPVLRLPAALAQDAWMKCDGLSHPQHGGSKIRALEFFLGEARAWGRPILAYGPEGSGWLLGLARFGGLAGLRVQYITFPQYPTALTVRKRRLLATFAGRRLDRASGYAEFGLRLLAQLPRLVGGTWEAAPAGGSDAVTTLGYVNAAFELAAQVERGELPRPDAVFLPVGSGGTAAGLTLGFGILGWETQVVGIAIAPRVVANMTTILRLAVAAGWLLNLKDLVLAQARVIHRFAGRYAVPSHAGEAAGKRFKAAGIQLDPVYTEKCGAAFLSCASDYKRPLFWNTFATPC